MAILEIESVSKGFPTGLLGRRRPVVRDLSLAVEPAEVFGFLGANGAGKTTTIKLIVALLFPDRGHIRIDGHRVSDRRARARLGYLPENPYFYDYLTGREFLDFYGRLLGLDGPARRRRVAELLERLSLGGSRDVPLRRYSKGMLQRIGFAQALLGEPRLLVLDEPMSGLDPIGRRDFRDLIMETRGKGATVFFSSHILQDAELICDRVAILADGVLRSQGRLEDLLRGSASGYEVEYEGAVAPDSLPGEARVVVRSGERCLVKVPTLESAEAVTARVRAAGGRLRSLVAARATLEEVFLREVREPAAKRREVSS